MSHRFKMKSLMAAAAVTVGLMATTAHATTKDLSQFGWMAEMDPGVDLTVISDQSDNVILSLSKSADFTQPPNANGFIPPLKIIFTQVQNPDGTVATANPLINIVNEQVFNNTGVTWSGFRWIVEGGLDNGGAIPHFDTGMSSSFATDPFTVTAFSDSDKELTATGGSLPSTVLGNLYTPGNTSGSGNGLIIAALPFTSGSTPQTFIFKEQPIASNSSPGPVVPLPAAAWMSLSSLVGLGLISNARNLKKLLS
jgi:hypothetical protein